jgi:hypothetical protein
MGTNTVSLIKGWSIVLGVLSLANLLVLTVYPIASLVGIIALVALLLGLAVAYVGVKVESIVITTVNVVFWAKLVWLLVNLVYSVTRNDLDAVRWVILLAQIAIMAYLIWLLRKMPKYKPAAMPSSTPRT